MPYTQPTLTAAIAALASRLNDQSNIHWTAAELQTYLVEALRTWSVWTQQWRDRGSFTTTINEAFYDLTVELPTLRGQSVTNWDLTLDVEYSLLEPPSANVWIGTDQFDLSQISNAIQRRRDQFLKETGVQLTRTTDLAVAAPVNGRYAFPEAVLNVRRFVWTPVATMFGKPLMRTDDWAANHYSPGWPISPLDSPFAYSVSTTPPLSAQLIPPPTTTGNVDYLSINAGAALDPTTETVLGIPDDYGWIIKYGALADLLGGDGLALDAARAQYCEQRWQQGIDMARAAQVVLAARINGVPVGVGALSDADVYSPMWQLVARVPKKFLLTGQNFIASWPPPGATGGPWTFAFDVVRNAPVPAVGADILQISQDVYDSILDIAQHLALLKEGPGQLQLSMGLFERAQRAAGITINFIQASQPDNAATAGQQQQDRRGYTPEQRLAIPQSVEG